MPRLPRYRPTGKRVTYLCRLGKFSPGKAPMKPADRRELIAQLEACCQFYGFQLLAYKCGRDSLECVVRHHGRGPTRADALRRIADYYGEEAAARLSAGTGDRETAKYMERAMRRYGDVSILIQRVKGAFSAYYTGIHSEPQPRAPLWKERFRSEVVQESAGIILAACAEVEKRHHSSTRNTAPGKDLFCSYGCACKGDRERRRTICELTGKSRWPAADRAYREQIALADPPPIRPNRFGRKGVIGELSLDKLVTSPANQPRNAAPRPRTGLTPASEHLASLRAFKKRFGHTRVPIGWPENELLSKWVRRCRKCYRQGQLVPMTEAALEALGFDFALPRGHPVRQELQPDLYPHDATWLEKFDQLAAYVAEGGRLDLSPSDDIELYRWLHAQRHRWRSGKLGADRIARLESIGA